MAEMETNEVTVLEQDQNFIDDLLGITPEIETFGNPVKGKYEIQLSNPYFTSVCPVTEEKDYATLTLQYIPDSVCIEFKSFRKFMRFFANISISHELVVNLILRHIVDITNPHEAKISAVWSTVDGTQTSITAVYDREKRFN